MKYLIDCGTTTDGKHHYMEYDDENPSTGCGKAMIMDERTGEVIWV